VQLHRDRGVLRYGTTFGRHARRGLVRAVLPARGALLGASSATHRLPRAR
jgi:hypothetical protein